MKLDGARAYQAHLSNGVWNIVKSDGFNVDVDWELLGNADDGYLLDLIFTRQNGGKGTKFSILLGQKGIRELYTLIDEIFRDELEDIL